MYNFEKLTTLKEPFFHVFFSKQTDVDSLLHYFKKKFKNGSFINCISGKECRTLSELFDTFQRAFEFPDYFGHNWAAFDECINDLGWLPAERYILIIRDFDCLLDEEPTDQKLFLKVLYDTSKEWAVGREYGALITKPTPFHVIFHCDTDKKDILLKQLGATDILMDEIHKTEI